MIPVTIVFVGLLLAYANGANDNFKGVATLLGSGTTDYRRALLWATVTTALGSVTALVLGRELLRAFMGKGLVPSEVVADPVFPAAVALAAGLTVLLATRLGFPISTTHALIGALLGAGLVASPNGVNGAKLASGFMLPLLTSPFVAVAGAVLLYPPLRFLRRRLGVSQETCVCVGEKIIGVVPGVPGAEHAVRAVSLPVLASGAEATCRVRYRRTFLGLRARPVLDTLHYLSAGAASFARGANDTPKIAALLLVGEAVAPGAALVAVGVVMAAGGLISARAGGADDVAPGDGDEPGARLRGQLRYGGLGHRCFQSWTAGFDDACFLRIPVRNRGGDSARSLEDNRDDSAGLDNHVTVGRRVGGSVRSARTSGGSPQAAGACRGS